MKKIDTFSRNITKHIFKLPAEGTSPERYKIFKRNIIILMMAVTIIPLSLMAAINYYQYQKSLRDEIITPLNVLTNKTKRSFELFLEERLSTVRFIASAYSFDELSDEKIMNRILGVLKKEFEGFVDLAVIDHQGRQISHAGPYSFLGKDYSQQDWFQEALIKGVHISDVFLGYRKFPHIALAVQNVTESGEYWIFRATIDTEKFDEIIATLELDSESDAFLINNEGILQTNSNHYGKILEKSKLSIPKQEYGTTISEIVDADGREIFMVVSNLLEPEYTLVVVKPRSLILKTWFTFRSEIFFIFIGSVIIIVLLVYKLTDIQVKHTKEADEKREMAFRELEHSQKLSSIGRLAAGVAHEINNPLAIICQKAGLMKDIVLQMDKFDYQEKFSSIIDSILRSVDRCSTITHRLLGFARRIDVEFEALDISEIIHEVIGFLEKEALHRNIQLELKLSQDLDKILADKGQLEQVFLNILTNAFAAVDDGGKIIIKTWEENEKVVAVSIEDNGCGMSKEDLKHIFEPFFTTKKGYGTGLGLPITYGIINKLGGKVTVESEEGVGSIFTIYLQIDPKKIKEEGNE